jgi:hypothetical protein
MEKEHEQNIEQVAIIDQYWLDKGSCGIGMTRNRGLYADSYGSQDNGADFHEEKR